MARQWGGDGPDRFDIVHYHRKAQRRAVYDWEQERALPDTDGGGLWAPIVLGLCISVAIVGTVGYVLGWWAA